ncbi:response regulator [Chitinimonas arctica]|nr:response regulator [Chitinimonas arctica]
MTNNFSAALIVDPSSAIRQALRSALMSLDILRVDVASSVAEARRRLVESTYNIVLCEYHLGNEESGHDFLEELRKNKALPLSTIFIMITGEASYPCVVAVAEETPDDYMLKPVQTGDLTDRIRKAFTRRNALMDIYEALHKGDDEEVLKVAQWMISNKSPYISDIVRLASQSLFRLGRYDEATKMYRDILAKRSLAWAKLGLSKIAIKQGDLAAAEQAMLGLVEQHLLYLPVYNQLTELYQIQERYGDALAVTEKAIKITPRSIRRLQYAGQLAYSLGDAVKAGDFLNQAVRFKGNVVDLDYRSIFYLALLQLDTGQTAEASSLIKQMGAKLRADPHSSKNRCATWYGALAQATEMIAKRETMAVIDIMRQLADQWNQPDFDFDFALDYLRVVDRLYAADLAETLGDWIRPLAGRFASSRYAHELMVQRVAEHPTLAEVINLAAGEIATITEEGARLLMEEKPGEAAERLADAGLKNYNNRLLAAAANAAARSFQVTRDQMDKMQVEMCLARIYPQDDNLNQRLRMQINGPGG